MKVAPRIGMLPLLLAFGVAPAAADTPLPKEKDVCTDGKLDKAKVATVLLDINQVGVIPLDWAQEHAKDPAYSDLTPRQRLLADPDVCSSKGVCSEENEKRIGTARITLVMMLSSLPESFDNRSNTVDPRVFFSDPEALVVCTGAEMRAQTPAPPAKLPLRVRGAADQLFYDRDLDAKVFASLDKATINLGNDDVQNKRSDKAVAAFGIPFTFLVDDTGQKDANDDHALRIKQWEAIPYAGINRNISTTKGKPASVSANTENFGLYFDGLLKREDTPASHVVGLRLDYLVDHQHAADLATIGLTYTPFVNGSVNDFIRFVPTRDDFISFRPIFDLRNDFGHYTRLGTTPNSRSFERFGTRSGVALTSNNPALPWDLSLTDTFLYGLSGTPNSINYFKTTLSFPLDPKRYFTFDISYSDGRREDTAVREKMWSIGFGAKY